MATPTTAADAVGALPPAGAPLGPSSLTWQLFADRRMVLLGPRAAVLQNMLPALGQGVQDHSVWFADTLARLRRSIGPIFGTVYGAEPDREGRGVRDVHTGIKGRLDDDLGGGRYHALDPATFYWAHATFVEHMVVAAETFIRPLSAAERDQVVAEHVTWWHRYGVSSVGVAPGTTERLPATWGEFQRFFDDALGRRLVRHRTAAYGVGYATKGWPRPRRVPRPVWAVVAPAMNRVSAFLTIGGMPPRGRELLGLPWSAAQERRYRRFARAVRALDPVVRRLPSRYRLHPIAARAFEREAAA